MVLPSWQQTVVIDDRGYDKQTKCFTETEWTLGWSFWAVVSMRSMENYYIALKLASGVGIKSSHHKINKEKILWNFKWCSTLHINFSYLIMETLLKVLHISKYSKSWTIDPKEGQEMWSLTKLWTLLSKVYWCSWRTDGGRQFIDSLQIPVTHTDTRKEKKKKTRYNQYKPCI